MSERKEKKSLVAVLLLALFSLVFMLAITVQQPSSKPTTHPPSDLGSGQDTRRRVHLGRILGRVVHPQTPKGQTDTGPLSCTKGLVEIYDRGHNHDNTLD